MIPKSTKIVPFPVKDINLDFSRNVRDNDPSMFALEYETGPIKDDIALFGQKVPVALEEVDGVTYPIQGFRRIKAISELATEEKIDPRTGKVFATVDAYVFKNLTEQERVELLVDHGQRKGLSRAGLFLAYERLVDAGITNQRDQVVKLYTLLEQNYPPKKDLVSVSVDDGKSALETWRGTMQTMQNGHNAPLILREQFLKRLRGQQNWPTNKDLRELVEIHTKEMVSNPIYSRSKPGPKFMEKYNALLKAVEEAAGITRPKSVSMRTRAQVEESLKTLESLILKIAQQIQLGNVSADKLMEVDKIAQAAEQLIPAELQAKLVSMLTTASPTAEPQASTSATEQKQQEVAA